MKTRHNKKRNTTPDIALRKWCVEQAVKLAPIPKETTIGVRYNTAFLKEGQIIEQAQDIYNWVTLQSLV